MTDRALSRHDHDPTVVITRWYADGHLRHRVARVVAAVVLALSTVVGLPGPVSAATVPAAPRSVAATAGVEQVRVTWRAPSTDGGRRIDRYRVVRWADGVRRTSVTVGPRKRALTLTGLHAGKRYSMTVQAHNVRGWGAASRVVRAVPSEAPPVPFGTVGGPLGLVAPQLDETTPSLLTGYVFDFGTDPYDDPADRSRLTPGGLEIVLDGNAGGSSLLSEVFAFETLARREGATLLKTGTEIIYDDADSKRTDLLVEIAGNKVGVSVARAVAFPFDAPYPVQRAADLLDRKLDDIVLSSAGVSAGDAWVKQVLVVVAYAQQHADTVATAYADLDAATKADTVVYVVVTDGDDLAVYGSDG